MTQPPQDRPDYPWGPSEADRGQRTAAAEQGPAGGGGSTRMSDPAPGAGRPAAPAPDDAPTTATPTTAVPGAGTPYTGTPHRGPDTAARPPAGAPAPYTGTPVDQLPPLGPPPPGGYAGDPVPQRPAGHHGPPGTTPVSTIVLLVTSGLVLLLTIASVVGVVFAAPAVLAIVALTRTTSDPESARRLTRIGWWIFAGLLVLGLVLIGVLIALFVAFAGTTTGGFGQDDPFGTTTAALAALTGAAR